MSNKKKSPKSINEQIKTAKTNNMDLPKGDRRITYVLDPSPIT